MLTDSGEEIALSAVVSNCDSVRTHRELINGSVGAAFERRRKYEPACSGVVLYLGLNKRYEHLAHHDFVFSRDPHEEFDWIYKKGEPAPDPTCYLAATTCTEPGTAPAGGEALYVLVHAPYLRPHHDWKKMLPEYRRVILEKLKRTGQMPDIESRIVFERALTPQDIHDRYHVLERRDLRSGQPRKIPRRIQARQSQPRPARPLPRGRRGASRSRHADGADVRLDRRRHARPRRGCVPASRANWRSPDENDAANKTAQRSSRASRRP